MKEASRKPCIRALLCGLAVMTGFAMSGCATADLGTKKADQKKIFVSGQSEGIQFWAEVEEG